MNNKILDLQKIIRNRAEKSLTDDINEIDSMLRKKHKLLGSLEVSFNYDEDKVTKRKISNLFYHTGDKEIFNKVFENNIDSYIEKATKDFLDEMEWAKGQMDNLYQELNSIGNE